MRLLAVRLQNLNSLSGTHEVRFDVEPLSAAGVESSAGLQPAAYPRNEWTSNGQRPVHGLKPMTTFSVSGKSTLLDAMTLA